MFEKSIWTRSLLTAGLLVLSASQTSGPLAQQAGARLDGSLGAEVCRVATLPIPGLEKSWELPFPGWVWVEKAVPTAPRFRSVTGLVTKSKVSWEDFPATHNSHDYVMDILVDRGQESVLADVGKNNAQDPRNPDTIHVEWETGVLTNETGKQAPERFFPRWAWPSIGDRVWANGHWIFDCGHPEKKAGKNHYETELHPLRAIASMRPQVRRMARAGNKFVQVTATDLYIHGRSGFAVQVLHCGIQIITSSNPNSCPRKRTQINEDFEFDIQAPPRPNLTAKLITLVENGPGNTVGIAPLLEHRLWTNPPSVHVKIPLAHSPVEATATYARKIYVGWDTPPKRAIRHFRVTLNRMDLHEDHDKDPGNCECTFFYMNVDRAPENEWIRLADFAQGNMNDYDDDVGAGDGYMKFSKAFFDFHVVDGQPFTVRANGYDQDCIDTLFGNHSFDAQNIAKHVACYADVFNHGKADEFPSLFATFTAPNYGVGNQDVSARRNGKREYELEFKIERLGSP